MNLQRSPLTVKLIGIATCIIGFIFFIWGLKEYNYVMTNPQMRKEYDIAAAWMMGLPYLMLFLPVVASVFILVIGYCFLRYMRWARTGVILVLSLLILISLIMIDSAVSHYERIIGTAIFLSSGYGIWYLWMGKGKQFFQNEVN
ncbi:MAG TPA: hypothetical protein PLJ26_01600 [Candidatus Omnitrophota bacterium]|nr:hypothetical protein [Candidatus Omnitrophota bacterium]